MEEIKRLLICICIILISIFIILYSIHIRLYKYKEDKKERKNEGIPKDLIFPNSEYNFYNLVARCPECGVEVQEIDLYCKHCGCKLLWGKISVEEIKNLKKERENNEQSN